MTVFLTDYRTAYTTQTELLEDVAYPQRVHRFPELWKKKDTGLIYVPHLLANKVLEPQFCKSLRDSAVGKKCAFILAAGNQHFAGINPKPMNTQLTYDYKILPLTLTQVYAGRCAEMVGAQNLVYTDGSACASSLKVMTDVIDLLEHKGFQRVVVLSVEDTISDKVLNFFGETGACLTLEEEQKGILPSAFDEINHGFYIGQGAVLAVFEKDGPARAILHGAGIASEFHSNAIGQREDGAGFKRAMWEALESCYIRRRDINAIKSHGTGTVSNNQAERAAIESVFDGHNPVVTSYKQRIGHTMGASGLLESCMLIDDIQQLHVVPDIMNRTKEDPRYLSTYAEVGDDPVTFMSLAAGMGNIYAAAIFQTT